tara:strand:- start:782 stop:1348 length:567 start_codon:yes stop_codon:yes gene_type:complete
MREFVYYSAKARTSGNFTDLMKAGRIDIVCNVIIQAFFISNQMRDDVHLHLIFDGQPNPPRHLEFISNKDMPISKKDVAGLIKRMLYKCSEKKKTEVFPGCFIEKKSFPTLLKELESDGKKICVLDGKGNNIREVEDLKDCVFIIGDHEGLPKKELKRYKDRISVGQPTYFASQTFVIIHNELDLRKL